MTCSPYTDEELRAKIARKKATIEAYEDAITALAAGAQSYSLDTGQTRQMVQRAQLSQLRNMLSSLENDLAVLTAKLCGGSVIARPAF